MPFPDGRACRVKKVPPARVELNIWVVVASRRAFTPEAAAAHRATESRGWKSLEAPPPSPRPRRPRAREMEGQQGIDALVSGAVGRVRDAVQGSRHAPMASEARASATDLAIDGRAEVMEWRGGALTARRMVTASAQSNRRDHLVSAPLTRRQGCRFAAFQPARTLLVGWGGEAAAQQPVEP